MNIRQIQEAREIYGIDGWGLDYFGINDHGDVVCHPTGEEHLSVELPKAIAKVKELGVNAPMILRFPQITERQIEKLHLAFREAIRESNFQGGHRGVFPFKVNQRREFIDMVVKTGREFNYGLEVGSKTEFIAALSYDLAEDSLFICNGFKDREFIQLGFTAKQMGKNVIVVVEGPDELALILEQSKHHDKNNCPEIGIRVKLYSRGSGKWAKSSGESSKFGLSTLEVLHCLKLLEDAGLQDKLAMLHFHIGSQITEIKRIKNAIKEASRVYCKVHKMGYKPRFLNIGGGVGVDYDGSKTSFQSSANYSLQEFANDVTYVIGEVCKNEDVACPSIVTESGRVIAAYHSIVVTNIREVQGTETQESLDDLGLELDPTTSHKSLLELNYLLENINRKNFVEYYHDAIEYYEEMFTLFNLGYIQLKDRAIAEHLFYRICRRALYFSSFERHQLEEFEDLQQRMVSKYLANFSIFQSIPDTWAIDQLFPVMPLSHHEEKPTHKATIVDITCDSDGCLEKFVDRKDVRNVLDLHTPGGNEPYYLGFFLVGAYQESLSNEHNLFGAINEAEIVMDDEGNWEVTKVTKGDPIEELLVSRNYDSAQMVESYDRQIEAGVKTGRIKPEEVASVRERLHFFMGASPYLTE